MKQRVLVMNGQRIVEANVQGSWKRQKVEKANGIKPGIYNLYAAREADKSKKYEGVIVHSDDKSVYQKTGGLVVLHEREGFDIVPSVGESSSISYGAEGKACAVAIDTLGRSRSR